MTAILPLNLTSDSWVSSKKLVTSTRGQMPWKNQVTVEAIPHFLNWKEVSPRGQKCTPPVTHCSNLCWRDRYFVAPLKRKQIWIDKPRRLPKSKVAERQRAHWQTVPWEQGPRCRSHLNQPCDSQPASLPRLQAPLSQTRGGTTTNSTLKYTPCYETEMRANYYEIMGHSSIPFGMFIFWIAKKKKKKPSLLSLILPNPNSLSCSLLTVVSFIPILLGSSESHFTVWIIFFEESRSTSRGKKTVKFYLWLFPRRTCRLYLLNGDEL